MGFFLSICSITLTVFLLSATKNIFYYVLLLSFSFLMNGFFLVGYQFSDDVYSEAFLYTLRTGIAQAPIIGYLYLILLIVCLLFAFIFISLAARKFIQFKRGHIISLALLFILLNPLSYYMGTKYYLHSSFTKKSDVYRESPNISNRMSVIYISRKFGEEFSR